MTDLNLKSFDQLYPVMIRKYSTLIVDENASVLDKINSIVSGLNATGKLTNDIVKNWNAVMDWVMNDGLTTDVNAKLTTMSTDGTLAQLINVTNIGDLTKLTTVNKTSLVNALIEVVANVALNTTAISLTNTKIGDITQLNTTDKTSVVNALKEIKTQANNNATTVGAVASGSPKAVYNALSDLQTAFPTGATGIYLVLADGGWYYWNNSAWTKGGTYQSSGISQNSIRLGHIYTDVIDPITEYVQLSITILTDQYYNNSGVLTALTGNKCFKVAVLPEQRLRVNTITSGGATQMACFYDVNGNFLSYINKGTNGVNTTYTNYEFIVPDNAYFVAIDGINAANPFTLEKKQTIQAQTRITNLETSTAILPTVQTLLNNASDFADATPTLISGFYDSGDGRFRTDVTGYTTFASKMAVKPNDQLQLTATVSGGATALAIFYDVNGNFLSILNKGVNGVTTAYTNYAVTVPANAYFITSDTTVGSAFSIQKPAPMQVSTRIKAVEAKVPFINSYWNGKKAVWFGTSIPAGGNTNYPSMVASSLGLTITNEAVGSSMARIGDPRKVVPNTDPYGWTGLAWQNVQRSLAMTLAEKQYLITNWNTWKTLLTNNPPSTLAQADIDLANACSYENKLVTNHLGTNRKDLYIFDHGHNDLFDGFDINTMPVNTRDRTYFLGAMNYLIDLILNDNPKARICFIGHYEDARKTAISQAQTTLSGYWDYPLSETWKKLGWTQQHVTTTGYWSNGVWTTGGASQSLSLTQIWMADDLHPHSDTSGSANTLIANVLSQFLQNVR